MIVKRYAPVPIPETSVRRRTDPPPKVIDAATMRRCVELFVDGLTRWHLEETGTGNYRDSLHFVLDTLPGLKRLYTER